MPHLQLAPTEQVWSLSGTVSYWVYGPRGEAQGLMLDVDGNAVQFVIAPQEAAQLRGLEVGQPVEIEGSFDDHVKGTREHDVYRFTRLVLPALDHSDEADGAVTGVVVRINHAKHGEANGVVLDTGDFIHTRPHGFEALGLKLGDLVTAYGERRPLFDGAGCAVEATEVNGVVI